MKVIAISDQHGTWPTIPPCDLLIVAGDQCIDNFGGLTARAFPDRQWTWFKDKWLPWRYRQPAKGCVVTWGNHDYCGHLHQYFHDVNKDEGKWTTVVCDRAVRALAPTDLTIYMTPWSNQFMDWAFMQDPAKLAAVYEQIPASVDILVSHQPPKGCGDQYHDLATGKVEHLGSVELRAAIERVKPKVVVCGHIHMGYGAYAIGDTKVFNVSVVNEAYQLTNPPTVVWDQP
jgi:hypothetical protein